MSASKPGVPHFYVASEIDMTAALQLRRDINTGAPADVKISVNDIIVKAAAKALRKFPALNSSYALGADGQPGIMQHAAINVGVAVALDEGLMAPVVKNADTLELSTIAAQIKDLASRARAGTIKQAELEGATFQVSNLGMLDVLAFVSIITPPLAASLAVGAVRRVLVFRDDGQVGAAEQMQVVLSVDHRVSDGATAARYLQELKRLLQSPMRVIV
jgi:pyruvate dehydrogenase E2 component (dihydrolipoamide acetyltransferase)